LPLPSAGPAVAASSFPFTAFRLSAHLMRGPAVALRIVEYRQKVGGFKKVEDRIEISEWRGLAYALKQEPIEIMSSCTDALTSDNNGSSLVVVNLGNWRGA
jgi:hypothetical protein